jgi:type I restriction enzyme, S subunit
VNSAVPLKRVVTINPETLPEDTSPDFEFPYVDIGSVGRGHLIDEPARIRFEDAPSRARRVLRPGDTVVSTVRTYLRAVLPIERRGLVGSTGFACLRPKPAVDPRFLGWWAQSDNLIEEVVARSVGVSYPAISPADLGEMRFPLLPPVMQRAIADFLDAETARVDALIAKKQRFADALQERWSATLARSLGGAREAESGPLPPLPAGWQWIQARHLFPRVTVGVVVNPSSYFRDEGVPFVHGTDVRPGWIDTASLKYLHDDDSRGPLRKSRLSSGDVVAMRVGEPGRAAEVPPELDGANCASVLIFKRSEQLHSYLAAAFLNSRPGRAQVEAAQYGAAQGVLNVSEAAAIRFPVPPPEEQARLVERLRSLAATTRSAQVALDRQVELLREHRQALITAAVTGELELPGVAA